jgi:uncharacterized glyoxalase superfamily protein PhnB
MDALSLSLLLKTSNIDATISFYVETLGFTCAVRMPTDNPTLCILESGSVSLMFGTQADWDSPGSAPTMTGQIYFEVADVTALYEKVRNQVEVLWGPEVYSYGRRECSVKDCNGYRLVFTEETRILLLAMRGKNHCLLAESAAIIFEAVPRMLETKC